VWRKSSPCGRVVALQNTPIPPTFAFTLIADLAGRLVFLRLFPFHSLPTMTVVRRFIDFHVNLGKKLMRIPFRYKVRRH
jgi:hypothetical protein